MSKHAPLRLTAEQFAAHQAKHGFAPDPKQANGASQMPQESSEAKKGTSTPVKGRKSTYRTRVEAEYAMILDRQVRDGEITFWMYEAVTLKEDLYRYTADFLVMKGVEPYLIEVKGPYIHEAGLLRFKAAASHPHWRTIFNFQLHQKTKTGWTQLI